MPIRVPLALSSPRTPTADALQQERQTQQVNDQYAQDQDFIAQQQKEQAKIQQSQEAAAADAARAQKAVITNAKRAGVQTQVDPQTGQEGIQRHEDGQPVYQAGFIGTPQVSDKGGAAKYRDARGSSYEVPFDAIRTEQDPAGETFYNFDVTGPDGSKQTMRQPAGTKPLFRVDPTTGNRLADMTDPATGSVRTQVVGIDRPTASKAAIAKRRDALQLRQNEISGESAMLSAQQQEKETLLRPVSDRLKQAQDEFDKIDKAKKKYVQGPDGIKEVSETSDGTVYEIAVDGNTDPARLQRAKSWLDSRARAEAALKEAKAAHEPAAAEVFGMQKQRDQLAIRLLEEKRRAEAEIRKMDEAAKAGEPVYMPEWQKQRLSLAANPRVHDIEAVAGLEDVGDPMAADVQKATVGAANKRFIDAWNSSFNGPQDMTGKGPLQPGQLPSEATREQVGETQKRVQLVDGLASGLTAGKPATVADSKAARDIAAKSLGMQPDGVEVSEQKPEGYYELTRNGEMFATLDPRNNRLTLLDTPASLQDKGAEIIANASPDGVPVYMVSSEQPFRPAEVRDLIQTGINAARNTKTELEAEQALADVGLDSAGIRQKVMAGKLSVQDGKMLNEKLNNVQQVNATAPAVKAEFGKFLTETPIMAEKYRNGTREQKAEVVNLYMDGFAAKAGNGVVVDRSLLAQRRAELLAATDDRGAISKAAGFTGGAIKSGIASLAGIGYWMLRAPDRSMRLVGGTDDQETNLIWNQSRDLVQRLAGENAPWNKDSGPMGATLGEVESWANRADSVDDMPDELADKLAEQAFTNYHGFSAESAADVETSRDTFNVKKNPQLRPMLENYLKTGNGASFQGIYSMLKQNARERQTAAEVQKYIERPRVATPAAVASRASLLGIQLDPTKATAALNLSKQLEEAKDEKQAATVLKQAATVLGLTNPDHAALALSEISREETTDPESWTGMFRGASVAGIEETATEVVSDVALAALSATVVGAPEAVALKGAQIAAKQGIRGALNKGFQRLVTHNLDSLANRSAKFARIRSVIGKGRAALGNDLRQMGEDFQALGIRQPKFGQALTTGQKAANLAVGTAKATVAGAPLEALEEGLTAVLSNDPSAAAIGDAMLQGAIGVGGITPIFAGVQGIRNAFTARGQAAKWEKVKSDYIAKVNESMAKNPGFKPLTVADFDAWQGLQESPEHKAATAEWLNAKQAFDAQVNAFAQASQAGPIVPPPSLLAAKVALETAHQNLAGLSQVAFEAMDEIRALAENERVLYTAAAKAAAGATDYTEAEAKALMQQSGANAVIFQQAQTLPANAQGPAQLKNLADIPSVTTAAPGVYRLPDGVRLSLPQPLVDMLAQKSPSMVQLMGRGNAPAPSTSQPAAKPAPATKPTKGTKSTPTPTTDATTPANPSPSISPAGNATPQSKASTPSPKGTTPVNTPVAPAVTTGKPLPAKQLEKITREAIGRIVSKSPKVKALVKETKKAHRYPTGGMWMNPDGTIAVHIPTIIQQLAAQSITDPATAGKRVQALLDEEIRHSANMEAARRLFASEQNAGRVLRGMAFESWRDAWYGDIWNNHFTDAMRKAVQDAYGDTLPSADWMRAMEGLRMLDQLRSTGSITEAVLLALEAVIETLRDFLDLVTAGGKQVIEDEIKAMQAVLAEYGYENGTVKPDAKKKPAKADSAKKPQENAEKEVKTPKSSDTRFEGQTITFNTMTFSPPSELRGKLGKPELPLTPSQAIQPATTQAANEEKQTEAQGQRQEVLAPAPETAPDAKPGSPASDGAADGGRPAFRIHLKKDGERIIEMLSSDGVTWEKQLTMRDQDAAWAKEWSESRNGTLLPPVVAKGAPKIDGNLLRPTAEAPKAQNPAQTTPSQFAAEDKAEFANLAEGLFSAPARTTYKAPIPPAKIGGFITLATKLVEREGDQKVDSPEKVAAFIDEAIPGGKARALSDAFWSAIRMANPSLPAGEVDWEAIYAELDKPSAKEPTGLISDAESARLDALNEENAQRLVKLSENQRSQFAIELGIRPMQLGSGILDNTHPDDIKAALDVVTKAKDKVQEPAKPKFERTAAQEAIWGKEISTPEPVKEKKPTDTKALRAMKTYLLEKLDDAIAESPDNRSAEFDPDSRVVIEVPGDGTFTLVNGKQNLQEFAKRAKSFPTTTPGSTNTKLTTPRPTGIPALGTGKPSRAEQIKAAAIVASTDPSRIVLNNVLDFGNELVATNGRSLIRIPIEGKGTAEDPVLYTPKGGEIGPQSEHEKDFGKYPNYKVVIPEGLPVIHEGLDTGRLWQVLNQARAVFRDVNFKPNQGFERAMPFVQVLLNPDGSIGVVGEVFNVVDNGGWTGSNLDTYEHNLQDGAQLIGRFDADYLMESLQAMRALGHEKVKLARNLKQANDTAPMMILGDKAEVVIMSAKPEVAKPAQQPDTQPNDSNSRPNLEPDSQNAGVGDSGGETGIQPQPGPTGRDGDTLDAVGAPSGDIREGGPLPADVPAALGGDTGAAIIREPDTGPAELLPGDFDPRGGRNPDDFGVEVEQRGPNDVAESLGGTNGSTHALGTSGETRFPELKASAPALTEDQAGDVAFVEKRLATKPGVLLTNGTGTGKTFSGLGVVKRMLDAGKQHILIVAPSDKVVNDWIATAKEFFDIQDVGQLESIQNNGTGNRVVVTTYANMGQNAALVNRPWDAVVTDEAHYLSQSKDGNRTNALDSIRALTLHRSGAFRYADMALPQDAERLAVIMAMSYRAREQFADEADAIRARLEAKRREYEARHKATAEADRPKVVMLSATPFAYHFSLDYAEGYLFDFPPENTKTVGRYNHPSPRSQFYMENFGYRMRTGKLTAPENATATGILERRFAEKLMREGAMSGRALQVEQDYGRHFVLTESELGTRVDEIVAAIRDNDYLRPLGRYIGLGDYLERRYLLEALKARESVERIKQHLALGRKVVVFHDYKKGGSSNPLYVDFPEGMTESAYVDGKQIKVKLADALAALKRAVPHFDDTARQLNGLLSPLQLLEREFSEIGIFNGDVPAKQRRAVVDTFNKSGSAMNVVLVQRASGKEGISLHDRDGKHQRVFIDLGIPGRPTDAIQSEGRIYRHGVMSNAIVEYLTTGTSFERHTFAQTIAHRASTAENLAMGERARALLQSFATGYMDAETMEPGPQQGTGGKVKDAAVFNSDPFRDAVALYYTNAKKTSRNKSSEGIDYFATPEPLGFKMVEWASIRPGEKVLEPSAGHGAIARFFPDSTNRHAVEPSNELAGRLALNATDVQIHEVTFEDYNIGNKFDAIVMNPPFGTAGKTAMDHVIKATKHLRNGGRIVALIPEGSSMEKRFDKWMESDEAQGIYLVAEYGLPPVTFERAGTSVKARVVVLDKTDDPTGIRSRGRRDFTGENVKDFFDAIKESSAPDRATIARLEKPEQTAETEAAPMTRDTVFPRASVAEPNTFQPAETWHAKKGKPTYVAKISRRLSSDEYAAAKATATRFSGYYSKYDKAGAIPGFQFDTVEDRDGFLAAAMQKSDAGNLSSAPAPTMPRDRAEAIVRNLTPKEQAGKLNPREREAINEARMSLASAPARQSLMLEQAAATLRGEGPPLAPGLRSMFNPQARRPATGERGLFDRPKDQLADSIAKAYRAVQMGQSTVMVPIRAVFQRLKAANPALKIEDYLAAIQTADERGDVMLEAANTTAEQQANAPFVVPSQSGPGVRMAWVDNRPPQVLASAPSNSPQTTTQQAIYEIRQQLESADAGRSEYPIPEERLRAQAKSLLQWAAASKRIIDRAELERATTRHAGLGGGEEHDVWHDAGRDRVVKLTKPGAYGIQQDLTRYLDTIEYSNRVFGDDIVIEGVVFKDGWPHILISQPFYRGEMLPQPEIDSFFTGMGAKSTGRTASYLMPDGARVYDAKPRNVLKLTDGATQPIDVQVALASAPARSVTAEQDAAYMAAVEAGDMETAQQMVDEAARAAGGVKVWHGGNIEGDVIDTDRRERGAVSERRPGTFFGSTSKEVAKTYPGKTNSMFFFLSNPFRISTPAMRPASWTGETAVKTGRGVANRKSSLSIGEAIDRAKANGYDGVVYGNIIDVGRNFAALTPPIASTVVAFNPNQIKSADPVTRDEAGNVIPLSQRFNPQSDSILFSAPAKETAKQEKTREILESMPPPWRDVLQDHWKGKTIEQIAEARGMSLASVGFALRMGQGRFQVLMNKSAAKPTVQVEDGVVKATSGRPDLAMSGNAIMAAVDQQRMTPEEVTHAEMQELALRMFHEAPQDAETLVKRYLDSNGTDMRTEGMSPALQAIVADAQARNSVLALMMAAGQLYTSRKTMSGDGSTLELVRLGWAWRDVGTETARALSQRQDPFDSPEERAAYYLQDALLTPPESIRNELRRNPANKERILAAWAARADQIKQEMLAEGIDLDVTFREFAKEQQMAEETIPEPAKPALRRAPKKTRQLVKAIAEGLTLEEALSASGMTPEQANKAYAAFRAEINAAANAAASQMKDELLRSAPAPVDYAANMGLPAIDFTKADLKKSAVENEKTRKLKEQRERKKAAAEIDLRNRKSRRKALDAISTRKANAFDKLSEFWRASILSGPQTHVVNLVSGLTFGTYEATFKKLATGAQADIARMFGLKPDAASLADVPAMISAVLPSIKEAFLAGIGEWHTQSNVFDAYAMNLKDADGQSFKESYAPALKGILGKIMRGISFRAMGAADAFVKSFFTRIEVVAQARQIARNENLTGEALRLRIAELTNQRGSIAWERALAQAKRITFQNEEVRTATGTIQLESPLMSGSRAIDTIDGLAKLIARTKKGDFGKLLKGLSHFTFPFVDTPTNIFKMGVTMSPVGGLLAIIDATRSLMRRQKGNAEEAAKIYNAARALDDLTNQLVAWGFILGLSELVKPGDDDEELPWITGTIPWRSTSPGEREIAYRTAPPQSIRIGGQWVSYKRLDPFASSLAFTVDAIKEFQSGKPIDEVWTKIGLGMMRNMQDKTFLQGVSDVVNAVQDPERFGTKWATNIAIGFIPNLIRQPIRTADPLFRESDQPNDMGFWDSLGRRVGYGIYPQGAAPAVDIWGREVSKNTGTGGPNTDWMLRLFSPLDMKDADNVDPLDRALLRYNMTHSDEPFGVTAPSREITRTIGGQQIKVSLDDAEYTDFTTKAGKASRAALGDRYNRDVNEKDVEDIKDVIQKVQGVYRDAAFVAAVQKRGGVNSILAKTTK